MLYAKQHANCKEILTRIWNFYTSFFDFTLCISRIKLVGIEFNVNKISTFFFLLLEGFILKECIWSFDLSLVSYRMRYECTYRNSNPKHKQNK
jgi:hypothetical protein